MPAIIVDAENAGVRLDRFLRKRLALMPLSQIYMLIRRGDVRIDGRKTSQSRRLVEGEAVEIRVAQAEVSAPASASPRVTRDLAATEFFRRNFHVLFEDEAVIVCNKPGGLVVHSGTGHTTHDTLIDLARSHLLRSAPAGGAPEPDLVHRLDRDTSGVILIAKNKRVLRPLNEALRRGAVAKEYVAVCHGRPKQLSGTIIMDLQRTYGRQDGTKMRVVPGEGAAAATSYLVEESHGGISRLRIQLHTGKTHQIRVHLSHIGNPIVGDLRYGNAELDRALFSSVKVRRRLYLHALRVSFPHPITKGNVVVTAPLPEDFRALMQARGG